MDLLEECFARENRRDRRMMETVIKCFLPQRPIEHHRNFPRQIAGRDEE